ncbi:MAG: hypothetical protein D3914_14395 [Candidatus Electrothrix sp. LOE2]|nr:hypothetical protein [Candidatus Electrothrix sp. LOE2]
MRHDQTQWLIHFVRDLDIDQDFPEIREGEFDYFARCELQYGDTTAFSVLKTVVRLGGLIAGYSFRNGKTTIYGEHPVVCATEMPLYSFAQYTRDRASVRDISAYGIAFLKSEFYEAGGRPVIYGLSQQYEYKRNDSFCRIIRPEYLPVQEQYRYVVYNPTSTNWIDWSHEREWRWKVKCPDRDYIWCTVREDLETTQLPGVPLFRGKLYGGVFTKLCVIVWNHREAEEIQELLTGFYLAGANNYSTPFDSNLLEKSTIIVLEDVVDAVENRKELNAQTIEGLEKAHLLGSIILTEPPQNAAQLIDSAFQAASSVGEKAAVEFIEKYNNYNGLSGYATVSTYEIMNPLIQFMIRNGKASGPYDGIVDINIKSQWSFSQLIDYNEYINSAVAESLQKNLVQLGAN